MAPSTARVTSVDYKGEVEVTDRQTRQTSDFVVIKSKLSHETKLLS